MLSGTITDVQIAELKASFPGVTLYKWPLKRGKQVHDIVYREIDQTLLAKITDLVQGNEGGQGLPLDVANEIIFDYCVLWPEIGPDERAQLKLGDVPSIVKSIQEKSGFVDITITNQVIGPDVHSSILFQPAGWGEPGPEDLQRLEEMYPEFEHHRVRVGKRVFVVRPLTRTDIGVINQSTDRYVTAAKIVTLWPYANDERLDWDVLPAGVIAKLGGASEDLSGWDQEVEAEEI